MVLIYQYLSVTYKFLVNDKVWKVDPGNPMKIWDGFDDYNSGIEI